MDEDGGQDANVVAPDGSADGQVQAEAVKPGGADGERGGDHFRGG